MDIFNPQDFGSKYFSKQHSCLPESEISSIELFRFKDLAVRPEFVIKDISLFWRVFRRNEIEHRQVFDLSISFTHRGNLAEASLYELPIQMKTIFFSIPDRFMNDLINLLWNSLAQIETEILAELDNFKKKYTIEDGLFKIKFSNTEIFNNQMLEAKGNFEEIHNYYFKEVKKSINHFEFRIEILDKVTTNKTLVKLKRNIELNEIFCEKLYLNQIVDFVLDQALVGYETNYQLEESLRLELEKYGVEQVKANIIHNNNLELELKKLDQIYQDCVITQQLDENYDFELTFVGLGHKEHNGNDCVYNFELSAYVIDKKSSIKFGTFCFLDYCYAQHLKEDLRKDHSEFMRELGEIVINSWDKSVLGAKVDRNKFYEGLNNSKNEMIKNISQDYIKMLPR